MCDTPTTRGAGAEGSASAGGSTSPTSERTAPTVEALDRHAPELDLGWHRSGIRPAGAGVVLGGRAHQVAVEHERHAGRPLLRTPGVDFARAGPGRRRR